jgi:hypothetical protein
VNFIAKRIQKGLEAGHLANNFCESSEDKTTKIVGPCCKHVTYDIQINVRKPKIFCNSLA